MAAIKKIVAKKPLAKKQSGGMAMYKPSTPFQDYLQNNKGAVASDTLGKSAGGGYGTYKAENPKNQKALGKAVKKDREITSERINKEVKATTSKKPKAQLGKIVKLIDKAMDAGKAVKKVSKVPVDFRKISTKTDVSDAFKLAERARLKKMLQDADKAKGKMQSGGTSSKKLMNVNTTPAGKNKFTSPTKRPMMAKMGGATKKKC